jgi:hypothetical protein
MICLKSCERARKHPRPNAPARETGQKLPIIDLSRKSIIRGMRTAKLNNPHEKGGVLHMLNSRNFLYAAIVAAGGFAGGMTAMQFAPGEALAAHHHNPRTLTAEEFQLVDRNGTQRALLQVTPRGLADLMMFDGEGNDRAEFWVARDGTSSLGFYDSKGTRRVLVGQAASGRSGLALYGDAGRQLASLSVTPDNQANLTLYDAKNGAARVGLGVAATGEPALVLFDQQGHDRAEIHVGANGNPGIALADSNGKSIAGLPVHESSTPAQQ